MPSEAELAESIGAGLGAEVVELGAVGGGDINDAYRVALAGDATLFVKTREGASPGEFAAEAAGLGWLAEGPVPVPAVIGSGEAAGDAWLALEWIEPGRFSAPGAERFGRALARLHDLDGVAHGWLPGGGDEGRQRLGALAVPSSPTDDWAEFYAGRRLLPLLRLARDRGAIDQAGTTAVERVCARIEVLAGPPARAARLHGDLWGGNVLAGADGEGRLIDPAAQGGHRELDLAMLRLFGVAERERIFGAYEELAPPAPGAAERVPLWQLQPLLVHAVLFGGHYGDAVKRIALGLI